MKKAKIFLVCVLLLISVSFSTISGNATSIKKYNVNLIYTFGDIVLNNVNVKVYKVADIEDTGEYVYVNEFRDCQTELNGIESQKEWDKVCNTLDSYIVAEKIKVTQSKVTDNKGKAKFSNIDKGLYLVSGVTVIKGNKKYVFDSFVMSVTKNTTAKPKCEAIKIKDKLIEYEIVIKWDDMDNNDKRPDKVIVDIYKDGKHFETTELKEDNDWSYIWQTNDDGSKWDVVQSKTPEGYEGSIEKNGNKFIITNSKDKPQGSISSPQTGDYTITWPYIVAMVVSGMLLMIIAAGRKRRENTK